MWSNVVKLVLYEMCLVSLLFYHVISCDWVWQFLQHSIARPDLQKNLLSVDVIWHKNVFRVDI